MENFKDLYTDKIGVLITNLGTPNAPTKKSLKTYLNQFLMDRRVVDINRALWVPLLKLIILNIRPKKSAKLYKKIWAMQKNCPLIILYNNLCCNPGNFLTKKCPLRKETKCDPKDLKQFLLEELVVLDE